MVVCSGFAAFTAVRKLLKAYISREMDVFAPKAEFVYYPDAIWFPTGLRKLEDLVINLANFKRMKANFQAAEATGLSVDGHKWHTSNDDISNDSIIIASGGHFIKKATWY